MPRRAVYVSLTAVALLLVACGGGGDDRFIVRESDAPFVPVIQSTDIAVGVDRLVLTLLDRDAAPTFDSATSFTARYFEPVEGGLRFREDVAIEVIGVGDERYYVAGAPLDHAGQWEIQVLAQAPGADRQASARLPFIVAPDTTAPGVGDPALPSPTLTLADSSAAEISSDPNPDPALYETAVMDALAQRRPFVVAFTTVAFCFGSERCQRAVDQLKRLAPTAGLLAIHAETFANIEPGVAPVPSESDVLDDWNLQSDMWIYVVDADGKIASRFEVVVSDNDLAAALQRVAAP